ncbi:MAG: ParA family protein [Hyphomicrobiaceae bacterium]|nr:ParA family protein [Hyphomicrobiaceae bacterium]
MRVWCAMNQKGGVGKTTLLLHLLVAAWLREREVCLIDLDPQGSAEQWADVREAKTRSGEPVVEHGMVDRLKDMLKAAEAKGVDLALVDTPGAVDRTMIYAAHAADLIIIPTRTSQLDLHSLEVTLETLEKMHALAKVVVVVNAVRANDKAVAVRELVEKRFAVPLVSVALRDRPEFSRSLDVGKGITEKSPKSAAARELEDLFDWLSKRDSRFTDPARRASA